MKALVVTGGRTGGVRVWQALCMLWPVAAWATDWPQYRGPATDGRSPDAIATAWDTNRAGFLVWTNGTLTNGFSSFAVSQGRAFTLITRQTGGTWSEYCLGVDAATGSTLWSRPIGGASWDPTVTQDGGAGTAPYNTGDGPRTTPAARDGRVLALSGNLHLVCLNATNGTVIWSNNLVSTHGASVLSWQNGASPCLDNDLVFVSLNSSTDNRNLAAFRTANGTVAWSARSEKATHSTPVVATIDGVRQAIFATTTGLVSLDRTTGVFLWKFTYPFTAVSVSMGASAVVQSNIVYCTASYGRGAAGARVTFANNAWSVTHLYYKTGSNYESIWMTPVCYQGHIYTLSGNNSGFLNQPLNCIELATGNLKWSASGFGKGGLILANTNLVALTERGQLVLIDPSPAAYRERVRYQALQFSAAAPGKCWNNPAFSDGKLYVRGTRGGVCVDVAAPAPPALKLVGPEPLGSGQLRVLVGTVDGTPLAAERLARIEVRATNSLLAPVAAWPKLTNPLTLGADGLARLTNAVDPGQPWQFYRAAETP